MTLRIGLLAFPRVQQLDLTGPFEVFASLPDAAVHLIWKSKSPVVSATDLQLMPDITFADCPALDVFCMPGGAGGNALFQDEEVLRFVREQAAKARSITSVCTGALVLAAVGLLRGKRPTTHWGSRHRTGRIARFAARTGNTVRRRGLTGSAGAAA